MLKISAGEREYLIQGVERGLRNDGRGLRQQRHLEVRVGVLGGANGSCSLQLAGTDILVGVKADLGEPTTQHPDQGRVQVQVHCCPSASPEFQGRGAHELDAELAMSLQRLIDSGPAVDLHKLCIVPFRHCWVLTIEALVLDSDGNLFDALSLAVRAALGSTRIPRLSVLEDGGATELQLSDDPLDVDLLDVTNVPVNVTLIKIGSQFIVDPTLEEELCMSARLTVAVNARGHTVVAHKGGRGGLLPSSLSEMLGVARQLGVQMIHALQDALATSEELGLTQTQASTVSRSTTAAPAPSVLLFPEREFD